MILFCWLFGWHQREWVRRRAYVEFEMFNIVWIDGRPVNAPYMQKYYMDRLWRSVCIHCDKILYEAPLTMGAQWDE